MAGPWIPVESKAFSAYRYDSEAQTIDIKFPENSKGLPVYRYSNVSVAIYQQFMAAESKGSFVMREFVKKSGEFPFTRLQGADAL